MMDMPDYKPSQIVLGFPPLTATMGRTETEFAAALIVRACQLNGDVWQPISIDQIIATLKSDRETKTELMFSAATSPFLRPDAPALVTHGFAVWHGEPRRSPIELTEKAFEAMRRWVRKSTGVVEAPNGQ